MTIRELIHERQNEIANGGFTPGRAAAILTELSALLGNVLEKIRETDVAYNRVLLGFLDTEKTSNRAKIRAECTQEYLDKREARDTKELATEMLRALKYYLKAMEEELRAGKHQT